MMLRSTVLKSTSAVAMAIFAGPVLADISAEDAWEKFQALGSVYGATFSAGTVNETSFGLEIRDPVMRFANPEIQATITLPDLTLRETGDGSVSIEQPETAPMQLEARVDGSLVQVGLMLTTSGAVQVMSGSPEAMTYDFDLAEMDLALTSFSIDGTSAPLDGSITLSGYKGVYDIVTEGAVSITAQAAISTLKAAIDMNEPDGGDGKLEIDAAYDGVSLSGVVTLPEGFDISDPDALTRDGFSSQTGFSTQGGSAAFSFLDGSDRAAGKISSTGGSGKFLLNSDDLAYDLRGTDVSVSVSGSEIPLPSVDFTMQDWAFGISMPVSKSTEERPFGLKTRLGGVSMNDFMWMIADPTGALPHDPVTLDIDLSGTSKLFFDLFNPKSLMTMDSPTGMPGELNSIALNKLLISAVGAELTGAGAFTFDNTDLATLGGIPRPEGKLDLTLVGAGGLMDKLVATGMLPAEQVFGVQMMLGIYAKKGDAPDTLMTTIEATPQGAILANGQPLPF